MRTPSSLYLGPPECHLGMVSEYGQPADIWSAACTIYHILGTVPLFSPWVWNSDDMLGQMASLLGPLPRDMMDKWETAPKYYDDCAHDDDDDEDSIEAALDRMSYGTSGNDYFEEELDDLADLLALMLQYRPSERITANEVCQSDWMQKWGLPAIPRTGG